MPILRGIACDLETSAWNAHFDFLSYLWLLRWVELLIFVSNRICWVVSVSWVTVTLWGNVLSSVNGEVFTWWVSLVSHVIHCKLVSNFWTFSMLSWSISWASLGVSCRWLVLVRSCQSISFLVLSSNHLLLFLQSFLQILGTHYERLDLCICILVPHIFQTANATFVDRRFTGAWPIILTQARCIHFSRQIPMHVFVSLCINGNGRSTCVIGNWKLIHHEISWCDYVSSTYGVSHLGLKLVLCNTSFVSCNHQIDWVDGAASWMDSGSVVIMKVLIPKRRWPSIVVGFVRMVGHPVEALLLSIGELAASKNTTCSAETPSKFFWNFCWSRWACHIWLVHRWSSLRHFFQLLLPVVVFPEAMLGHCIRFLVILVIDLLTHVMNSPLDRVYRLNRSFPLSHGHFDYIWNIFILRLSLRI